MNCALGWLSNTDVDRSRMAQSCHLLHKWHRDGTSRQNTTASLHAASRQSTSTGRRSLANKYVLLSVVFSILSDIMRTAGLKQ